MRAKSTESAEFLFIVVVAADFPKKFKKHSIFSTFSSLATDPTAFSRIISYFYGRASDGSHYSHNFLFCAI